MTQRHRSRNPSWKTRALVVRGRERVVQRFRAEVVSGRDKGAIAASNDDALEIGTAPGNQLILTDAAASRHHCVIEAQTDGFLVRDIGSTNGTFLGEYCIQSAFLEPGSILTIGESSIRFDCSANDTIRETLSDVNQFGAILGASVAMRRVFALLNKVVAIPTTLLFTGETGTGKSALAEAVHNEGPRKSAPFVVIDCAAIPDQLMESELFGHEKGAFTGADERRIGAFETANGGTIFLDEVGELGIDMQPKLLRVLENRQFRRVGGSESISVDVRIIAATNRDLREEVNQGTFRSDLFYRLNVVPVELPPLRARPEDIPMLIEAFYQHFTQDQESQPPAQLLSRLMRQKFPGNVRELRSAIERAVILGDLGSTMPSLTPAQAPPRNAFDYTLSFREAKEMAMCEWESLYIPELLIRYDGNLSRAARAVSMDRNHLRKLLKAIHTNKSSAQS